jgi:hypothetical protein
MMLLLAYDSFIAFVDTVLSFEFPPVEIRAGASRLCFGGPIMPFRRMPEVSVSPQVAGHLKTTCHLGMQSL